MTGLMETVESRRQAFHEFPQPLGNPAKRRAGLSPSPRKRSRTKSGGKSHGKETPSAESLQDHVYWKQDLTFRIILGLEYARVFATASKASRGSARIGGYCGAGRQLRKQPKSFG
jgi:hypothetical protein